MTDDVEVIPANPRPWLWKKGQSGNPRGRPSTAQKLDESFSRALLRVFKKMGETGLLKLAEENPAAFCEVIIARLPKITQINIDEHSTHSHEYIGLSEVRDRTRQMLIGSTEGAIEGALQERLVLPDLVRVSEE